jgi:hypothetical protein
MTRDDTDAKLAGLNRRVQARAEVVRAELQSIGALDLAEECKSRFSARLAYLKTPRIELGSDTFPGRGCVWTEYLGPKVKHEYQATGPQQVGQVPGRRVRDVPPKRPKKPKYGSAPLEQRWHGGQGADRASGDDPPLLVV